VTLSTYRRYTNNCIYLSIYLLYVVLRYGLKSNKKCSRLDVVFSNQYSMRGSLLCSINLYCEITTGTTMQKQDVAICDSLADAVLASGLQTIIE